MKRIVTLVLMSAASVALVFAASDKKRKSEKAAMSGDEQAIRQIEADWAAALVKADFSVIDRVTSPDWTLTTSIGQLLSKSEANAELKSGDIKFESFKVDDLKIKIYGDTAVAFGINSEKSMRKGKDISGQYRFTDMFVKRDGRWQCVASHVSKIVKQ